MNSVKEDSQDLKEEERDALEIEKLLIGFIQTLGQETQTSQHE